MSGKKRQQNKKSKPVKINQVDGNNFLSKYRVNGISILLILLITTIVYAPSLNNGFTNWDDNVYVAENPYIRTLDGDNIKSLFNTNNHVSLNYHPITILSLAIDYNNAGFDASAYHLTNLIFHLLNTLLVFVFVYMLCNKQVITASFVALFFAVHPMHVESVAWISERKDVLYVFFFLGSLIAYLKYIATTKNKALWYILVIVLFLLSTLSKAMAIILPIVLFIVDYYKGRALNTITLLEKAPFLACSIYYGLVAVDIQSNGALASYDTFSLFHRVTFGSYGFVMYIYKFFVPINLSNFYPYPTLQNGLLPTIFYIAPIIVIALFALALFQLKKSKVLLVGLLMYLTMLVMVLQFISVGTAIIAERYTYLAYLGLLLPIAVGFNNIVSNKTNQFKAYKTPVLALAIVAAIAFSWLSFKRIAVWENSEVLWTNVIEQFPNDETGYRNRGSYEINKAGFDVDKKTHKPANYQRALDDFNTAIAINPNIAKVYTNRANIYGTQQRYELSLADYSKAIELDSSDAEIFANRAVTYSTMQQFDKAIVDYNKAISMKPNFVTALQNRAYAYVASGDFNNGLNELNKLIANNPTIAQYFVYRGVAHFNLGNFNQAVKDNTSAIKLEPNNARAYLNRFYCHLKLGNTQAAAADKKKAQELGFQVN